MTSGVVIHDYVANMVINVLGSEGLCARRELSGIDPSQNPEYIDQATQYRFQRFLMYPPVC